MLLKIYHRGSCYQIECPDNARVHRTPPDLEDCLVLTYENKKHYLLTPFAIAAAQEGR